MVKQSDHLNHCPNFRDPLSRLQKVTARPFRGQIIVSQNVVGEWANCSFKCHARKKRPFRRKERRVGERGYTMNGWKPSSYVSNKGVHMRSTQCKGEPPLADSDLGIWFDGRSFHYQEYRYDKLEDAVAYAKIDQKRHSSGRPRLPQSWEQWSDPTGEELDLMAPFGIGYERGMYHFHEFRYDTLEQAIAYARQISAAPTTDTPFQQEARVQ